MSTQYATKDAYNVYKTYVALGRHFTTDNYDYHKYYGKTRTNPDKFMTRPDVYYFYKLSKLSYWFDLLLANYIKNPKVWVRDLLDDEAHDVYLDWKKRQESLTYTFKSELNVLDDDLQSNFYVTSGQHPKALTLYLSKQLSLETFSILCELTNVLGYWEKEVQDRIIAKDIFRLSKKYYPFLEIDRKKFTAIIADHFS